MRIVSESPSGKMSAFFECAGQYRPAWLLAKADSPFVYYELSVGPICFPGRKFTAKGVWSPGGRYFAAEEWELEVDDSGPVLASIEEHDTHMLVIDTEKNVECVVARVHNGHVVPVAFEGGLIVYYKEELLFAGLKRIFEIEFKRSSTWKPCSSKGS